MSIPTETALTWADIVAIEPAVADIIEEAQQVAQPDWHDYTRLKRRLSALVGWNATDPRLSSSGCFDAAIRQLVEALGL